MSYTGENGQGKKYIHAIVAEGVDLTLDDIIVRVGTGLNNRILNIKSVTNSGLFWGVNLIQQDSTIIAPSTYGMSLLNNTYITVSAGLSYNLNGSTQKLMIRTAVYSDNRGLYQITVTAGVGNNSIGFDKFSILIERL